jgi:hypothetical protein
MMLVSLLLSSAHNAAKPLASDDPQPSVQPMHVRVI